MIEYTGAVKPPVREFGKRDSGRLETGMSVLIIDEWMRYPLSEMESRDVLEIADARYHKGSTILCSQFDVPGWVEQVPNKLTADAICDRFAHDSHKSSSRAMITCARGKVPFSKGAFGSLGSAQTRGLSR